MQPGNVISLGLLVVLVVIVLSIAIKIVREYQRLVVFRLGRSIGQKGPGIVFLIPIVDHPFWVDLREQFLEVPHQSCITQDNATISVDFLIYWKVVGAVESVVQVANFAGAINQILREKLDEITERWGVKVTAVEIREILPPREVQEAMTRQMTAERTRRAVVLEADGKRQATITVAEGDKQSAILRAEGDRQAAILRAEGFSLALDTIFGVAKTIDAKTMSLQYLDALKTLGASPATKFVLPMEFTHLLRPFVDYAEKATE